ncbi:MAG: type II secretion system major pseudopilin GspG [Acidobacteria bacterium]|nr:type II secretion system major pseudopilin GspG [Acidobacteriota bacterium]
MNSNLEGNKSEKGFSLIELIVVLVILGLLATVVAPRVYDKLMKGREEIAKIQIKELEGALQLYAFDMGRYPNSAEGLEALVRNVSNSSAWNGPYLSKKELPRDPWDEPYKYRCPGLHGDFDLFSTGPDGADGGDDDICNWK